MIECKQCVFWFKEVDKFVGQCRAKPPTATLIMGRSALGEPSAQVLSFAPETAPDYGCGQGESAQVFVKTN